MGTLYQPAPPDKESHSRPLIIAVVMIIVVGGVLWLYSRRAKPVVTGPIPEATYASNLSISDLHLATAQNFVGGEVTYLEGKIANTGASTVTAAQVQCLFRNSLGEVVDQPVVALQVEAATLGQTEFVPLSRAPLAPNQQLPFRLTFEHISSDWNQGFPELRVVSATTK